MDEIRQLNHLMGENRIGIAFSVDRKATAFCAPYSNAQRFFHFLGTAEQLIGRTLLSLFSHLRVQPEERPAGVELFHIFPEKEAFLIYHHFPEIISRMECGGS